MLSITQINDEAKTHKAMTKAKWQKAVKDLRDGKVTADQMRAAYGFPTKEGGEQNDDVELLASSQDNQGETRQDQREVDDVV